MRAMELPTVGDVINDRYRLEETLGDGGFGTVFRATDVVHREVVALKLLHPDDGDGYRPGTLRRFEREVGILQQLESPHTVRLLGFGSTPAGQLYIVFEHLPGRDLSELLRGGPLPAEVVEHIVRQLLASLSEAHRAGLLHRDIKPANIRVMRTSEDPFFVKLLDFGIARSAERDRVAVTKTGELVGTPRYMSPEQLREQELTAASDLYSLGVVAFEMLAGPGALGGNSVAAQLDRLRSGHVFAIPEAGGSNLHHAIQRMTTGLPEARVRTTAQVLEILDVRSPIALPSGEASRGSFRIPLLAALGVCIALIAGAAVIATQQVDEVPTPRQGSRGDHALLKTAGRLDQGARRDDAAAEGPVCIPEFRGFGRLRGSPLAPGIAAYVPDATAPPLVVVLHGKMDLPSDMVAWLERSGLPGLADRKGFAIIAPRDEHTIIEEPWDDEEDVSAIHAWVEAAQARLCTDPERVYVVYQSDASFLDVHLRCQDWVTAVGSNGSRHLYRKGCPPKPRIHITPRDTDRLPEDVESRCRPPIPIRGRQFRGKAMPLDVYRQRVREWHKCAAEPTQVFQHEEGHCITWACGVATQFCVHEGGEPWPGTTTTDECAGEAGTFPVGEVMWHFFESLDVTPNEDHE